MELVERWMLLLAISTLLINPFFAYEINHYAEQSYEPVADYSIPRGMYVPNMPFGASLYPMAGDAYSVGVPVLKTSFVNPLQANPSLLITKNSQGNARNPPNNGQKNRQVTLDIRGGGYKMEQQRQVQSRPPAQGGALHNRQRPSATANKPSRLKPGQVQQGPSIQNPHYNMKFEVSLPSIPPNVEFVNPENVLPLHPSIYKPFVQNNPQIFRNRPQLSSNGRGVTRPPQNTKPIQNKPKQQQRKPTAQSSGISPQIQLANGQFLNAQYGAYGQLQNRPSPPSFGEELLSSDPQFYASLAQTSEGRAILGQLYQQYGQAGQQETVLGSHGSPANKVPQRHPGKPQSSSSSSHQKINQGQSQALQQFQAQALNAYQLSNPTQNQLMNQFQAQLGNQFQSPTVSNYQTPTISPLQSHQIVQQSVPSASQISTAKKTRNRGGQSQTSYIKPASALSQIEAPKYNVLNSDLIHQAQQKQAFKSQSYPQSYLENSAQQQSSQTLVSPQPYLDYSLNQQTTKAQISTQPFLDYTTQYQALKSQDTPQSYLDYAAQQQLSKAQLIAQQYADYTAHHQSSKLQPSTQPLLDFTMTPFYGESTTMSSLQPDYSSGNSFGNYPDLPSYSNTFQETYPNAFAYQKESSDQHSAGKVEYSKNSFSPVDPLLSNGDSFKDYAPAGSLSEHSSESNHKTGKSPEQTTESNQGYWTPEQLFAPQSTGLQGDTKYVHAESHDEQSEGSERAALLLPEESTDRPIRYNEEEEEERFHTTVKDLRKLWAKVPKDDSTAPYNQVLTTPKTETTTQKELRNHKSTPAYMFQYSPVNKVSSRNATMWYSKSYAKVRGSDVITTTTTSTTTAAPTTTTTPEATTYVHTEIATEISEPTTVPTTTQDVSIHYYQEDETPICAKHNNLTYCLQDPEYPRLEIQEAIERNRHPLDHFLVDISASSNVVDDSILQRSAPLQSTQVSYSFEGKVIGPSHNNGSSEHQGCSSSATYARPLRALNTAGKWKVIVNVEFKDTGANYTQTVRIEECSRPFGFVLTCGTADAISACLQQYKLYRLLAWEPHRGFYIDAFLLPVSCFCGSQQNDSRR